MYRINFEKIYTDQKYCLCGCQKVISEENWGIKVSIEGSVDGIQECLEIINLFENEMRELSQKTLTCKYCGHCCENAPEVSEKEIEYFSKLFPELASNYKLIKPGSPCLHGGKDKAKCLFPLEARPLQCRILFCQANIVGFEKLYTVLAEYLGWSKL
jgi:hypothetical protein